MITEPRRNRPAAPADREPAFEVVERRAGALGLRTRPGRDRGAPDGTYNFVRVHGAKPGAERMKISARLPHAALADGASVIYAGTIKFQHGDIVWWSNYSGTYQPIAAFRSAAGLPDDLFMPWERLQLGGHAQQRTTFTFRPVVEAPEKKAPMKPDAQTQPHKTPAPAAKTDVPAAAQKRAFAGARISASAPPAIVWGARAKP